MTSIRDFILEIINKYYQLPCLWQMKHMDYHDKVKRNNAWDEILTLYRTKDPQANRDTVIKKITSLRGAYKKELRKVIASKETGTEDVHVPKLWYFDHMQFLNDQEMPRENQPVEAVLEESTLGTEDEGDENDSFCQTELCTTGQSPTSSRSSAGFKRQLSKVDEVLEKISKKMDQPFQSMTPQQKQRRPHDAFGEHVAERLRSMPGRMVPFCQKLINDAIFLAELESLTRDSRIVGSTDSSTAPKPEQ